jgi:hypothetical protein
MRIQDPGSGMETVQIRDPGWKKVGSGIRDKHPGSATLILGHQTLDPDPESGLNQCGSQTMVKGTVSRDFLLLVFLMNQFPPSPRVVH